MNCPGRINLNMVLDRETAEARGEPTHFPCQAALPNLSEILDRMTRLKDLLRAADQLQKVYLTAEAGPLLSVMESALQQANQLDDIIFDLWEPLSV